MVFTILLTENKLRVFIICSTHPVPIKRRDHLAFDEWNTPHIIRDWPHTQASILLGNKYQKQFMHIFPFNLNGKIMERRNDALWTFNKLVLTFEHLNEVINTNHFAPLPNPPPPCSPPPHTLPLTLNHLQLWNIIAQICHNIIFFLKK